MLSTLTVAWALAATAAQPQPISAPASEPSVADSYDDGYGGDCGCEACGGGCGHSCDPLAHLFWRCHSPCNMAPPEPPCSDSHGYYYFRPYNYGHVAAHQEFAAEWGIDTRNPYSNEIFQGIYERAEAEPVEVRPGRPIEEVPGPAEPAPRGGVRRGRDSAAKAPAARTANKLRGQSTRPQGKSPARPASLSTYSGPAAVSSDRDEQPRRQSRLANR